MIASIRYFHSTACILAIAAILAIVASGCGHKKNLPSLHPVHGRVQFKSGKPVTSGLVCFQSQADTTVSASGAIAADGTFTITSFRDKDRRAGAVPGPHRVIIMPPPSHEETAFPTTTLPNLLTVNPGDNEFTLTVDEPK